MNMTTYIMKIQVLLPEKNCLPKKNINSFIHTNIGCLIQGSLDVYKYVVKMQKFGMLRRDVQ